MKFLLDTNVVSELRRPRPHGAVLSWYGSNPQSAYVVPSVVLLELQAGVEKTREHDPQRAEQLDRYIDDLALELTIVTLDGTCAREAGRMLHRQQSHLGVDAMIAAMAKVNGFTVATRNTRDFEALGVPLVNPFLFERP